MFKLTREPIDLASLISAVQTDDDGAVTSFLGVVRNNAGGRRVLRLEYYAYEAMALKQLQKIGDVLMARWDVRAAIVHRLGCLKIGEASVAIAVASPHRADAFEACRHAIEQIKKDVPIWKKEHYEDGAIWIEGAGGGELLTGGS